MSIYGKYCQTGFSRSQVCKLIATVETRDVLASLTSRYTFRIDDCYEVYRLIVVCNKEVQR